ncbi:MAG: hypothetical protein KJ687_04800, partial [Proteobacteria bacterium]|nr:hypothetical protein [Pseudomonadota bacterium]
FIKVREEFMHTFAFIRACQNRLIDFYNEELRDGDSGECPSRENEDSDSTMNKGMLYFIQTPPYGGGEICLTPKGVARIRSGGGAGWRHTATPLNKPCDNPSD